jgi:hypothetical protein
MIHQLQENQATKRHKSGRFSHEKGTDQHELSKRKATVQNQEVLDSC